MLIYKYTIFVSPVMLFAVIGNLLGVVLASALMGPWISNHPIGGGGESLFNSAPKHCIEKQ